MDSDDEILSEDEAPIINSLRQIINKRDSLKRVTPYFKTLKNQTGVTARRDAANKLRKSFKRRKLLKSTNDLYQRFLSVKRSQGFRSSLRPLVDKFNEVLPQGTMFAAHGIQSNLGEK